MEESTEDKERERGREGDLHPMVRGDEQQGFNGKKEATLIQGNPNLAVMVDKN